MGLTALLYPFVCTWEINENGTYTYTSLQSVLTSVSSAHTVEGTFNTRTNAHIFSFTCHSETLWIC